MPVSIQVIVLEHQKNRGTKRTFTEVQEEAASEDLSSHSVGTFQGVGDGGSAVTCDMMYCGQCFRGLVNVQPEPGKHPCLPAGQLLASDLPAEMPHFKETGFLAALHSHPYDASIKFDDPTHTYSVEGWENKEYPIVSVTGFIHHNFNEFDADAVICKMQNGTQYGPQHPYYGLSPEEIKAQWKANGALASSQGTKYHYIVESFYNGVDIQTFVRFKVVSQFLRWHHATIASQWVPYRTEMRLKSPQEYRTTGTIDALFVAPNHPLPAQCDGTLEVMMVDWKFSKLIRPTNPYQKGRGLCSNLDDCNQVHYFLQLNAYKWMVERYPSGFRWNSYTYTRVKVVKMILAVFHDVRAEAQVITVPDLQPLVSELFEERRLTLAGEV